MFNETTFFAKYNKAVESIFLCSYHAYNRCDGAGVVPKRLSKQAQREGAGPIGGASYAHAVNMSNYLNHVAFHFDQVNRSEYVFSSELQEYTNMRKMCHFQYHYIDAHGAVAHEPGIVLVKMTSDDALSFQVIDMVRRQPEQAMCPRCSNHHQRPVQHNVEKSQCTLPPVVVLDRTSLAFPDPNRLRGPQVVKKGATKRKKSKGSRKQKVAKAFVCRSTFCAKDYGTLSGVNRHMAQMHPKENLCEYVQSGSANGRRGTVLFDHLNIFCSCYGQCLFVYLLTRPSVRSQQQYR